MKTQMINRNGLKVYFEQQGKDKVKVSCPDSMYLRCGGDTNKRIFIDFEGGPFIAVGMRLDEVCWELAPLYINEIKRDGKDHVLVVNGKSVPREYGTQDSNDNGYVSSRPNPTPSEEWVNEEPLPVIREPRRRSSEIRAVPVPPPNDPDSLSF